MKKVLSDRMRDSALTGRMMEAAEPSRITKIAAPEG